MLPFLLTSNWNNYTLRLFITRKSETPPHPIHDACHAIVVLNKMLWKREKRVFIYKAKCVKMERQVLLVKG